MTLSPATSDHAQARFHLAITFIATSFVNLRHEMTSTTVDDHGSPALTRRGRAATLLSLFHYVTSPKNTARCAQRISRSGSAIFRLCRNGACRTRIGTRAADALFHQGGVEPSVSEAGDSEFSRRRTPPRGAVGHARAWPDAVAGGWNDLVDESSGAPDEALLRAWAQS